MDSLRLFRERATKVERDLQRWETGRTLPEGISRMGNSLGETLTKMGKRKDSMCVTTRMEH